ncbi:hypothetical protein [Bifidobacterium colobi]|uniref:hypothetical protein n=1 Tax=Bifidobacterium colobi TaxID=2809026 RepID=UPI00247B0AAB|nr:hypothetical protein [Bifidobacterium colobi]
MAKAIFPDYDYVNLENPETRKAAIDDPWDSFVSAHPNSSWMRLNTPQLCFP